MHGYSEKKKNRETNVHFHPNSFVLFLKDRINCQQSSWWMISLFHVFPQVAIKEIVNFQFTDKTRHCCVVILFIHIITKLPPTRGCVVTFIYMPWKTQMSCRLTRTHFGDRGTSYGLWYNNRSCQCCCGRTGCPPRVLFSLKTKQRKWSLSSIPLCPCSSAPFTHSFR